MNIATRHFFAASLLAGAVIAPAKASQCNFTQMGGTLIDFGIISAANNNDIIGIDNVQFTCTDGLLPTIGYTLAISEGSSGSFASRSLKFAGLSLDYNLYTEPTYTQIFGDGQVGTNSNTVSGICVAGIACVVPVYGRINGGQPKTSGQYSDEVVITISF